VQQAATTQPPDSGIASPRSTAALPALAGNPVPEPAVAAMFDEIAPVYDRMNTLMTLGADDAWRRRAARAAELHSGDSAIDVACGTGKLSVMLAEVVGPFGHVQGVDLSEAMIERAATEHHCHVQLEFAVANALDLPFGDGRFDAATIAFGVRNLADYEAGFRELARLVRPGGRVVCLELSVPPRRAWAGVYRALFRRTAPLLAGLAGGSRDAYRYLPASLEAFPDADELSARMRSAGLADVRFWRLAAGAVALHRGIVPG
jgi:demethylmenaquinone methyltransferase/2-methoxy-6-polyprenyl-1,4-benzoquinol methylase